jgi:hypothetical protein
VKSISAKACKISLTFCFSALLGRVSTSSHFLGSSGQQAVDAALNRHYSLAWLNKDTALTYRAEYHLTIMKQLHRPGK